MVYRFFADFLVWVDFENLLICLGAIYPSRHYHIEY